MPVQKAGHVIWLISACLTGASAAASEAVSSLHLAQSATGRLTQRVDSAGRRLRQKRAERHQQLRYGEQAARSNGEAFEVQVPAQVVTPANLTEPTAFPPPPPQLDPYQDMQPLDTRIGHFLINNLIESPTLTPPPSNAAMDVAFACNVIAKWPEKVAITAPDPCTGIKTNQEGDAIMDLGSWMDRSSDTPLLTWQEVCLWMDTANREPAPLVQYNYQGDLLSVSQEKISLIGTQIALRDCQYQERYTLEEKTIHQDGEADARACKEYNSCDGVVYLQYTMRNEAGEVVATTQYLPLFPESFTIIDATGAEIASVSRSGWDPYHVDCANDKERAWDLTFAPNPPGVFARVTERQWIGQMITMIAIRDNKRGPDGHVTMCKCGMYKLAVRGFVMLFLCCCCTCLPMFIWICISAPLHEKFYNFEKKWCPRRRKS